MNTTELRSPRVVTALRRFLDNAALTGPDAVYVWDQDTVLCQVLLVQPAYHIGAREFFDLVVWNTETGEIEDWRVRDDRLVLVMKGDEDGA